MNHRMENRCSSVASTHGCLIFSAAVQRFAIKLKLELENWSNAKLEKQKSTQHGIQMVEIKSTKFEASNFNLIQCNLVSYFIVYQMSNRFSFSNTLNSFVGGRCLRSHIFTSPF